MTMFKPFLPLSRFTFFRRCRKSLKKLLFNTLVGIDYCRFRCTHYFGNVDRFATDEEKTIVIVSLTDWIPRIKNEAMLALSLAQKGYQPVILTYRSARWARLYFRAFGISRFIFFDEIRDRYRHSEDEKAIDTLFKGELTFHGLLQFRHEKADIGKHALSTVLRRLKHGTLNMNDPAVRSYTRSTLLNSLWSLRAARSLFQTMKPAAVLWNERGYTPYGEIFDAAAECNLNCIQHCHIHTLSALVLKRYHEGNKGIHPHSLSQSSWETVKNLPWDDERSNRLMRYLQTSYESGAWCNTKFLLQEKHLKSVESVKKQLELDPTKKTAVVFSHVLWDATFFYGENLFDDYEEWLIETVRVACANTSLNWIIKLHPDYVWKMHQAGEKKGEAPRDTIALAMNFGSLPKHVRIVPPETDINTYSFFSVTDYCLTVRGTIGIEAACFGIPVITAGTGRYANLGFTRDSSNREDYLSLLAALQNLPPLTSEEVALAQKHAYALLLKRAIEFSSFEMRPSRFRYIHEGFDQNVHVAIKSQRGIAEAPDLQRFAAWCLDSSNEDYLDTSCW